jgi:hypothetical protein
MTKSTVRKPASKRSLKPRSAKKVAPRKLTPMTLAKRKLRSFAKSASDVGDSVKRSMTRMAPNASVRRKPSASKAA